MLGFWASTATGVSWALPMPSWTSVRSFAARAIGGEYGGSDGRAHLVPGSATRASRGASGTRPGSAPGQLPAYSVKAASRTATRTGPSPLAAHHGFDPKTSTLDVRKSTAQQDVFENADGTTSVKDYQRPVNYRKADGTWAKIDTKLVKRASGRFAQATDGAGASFAASAADPSLLSYSFAPGESVSFGLVGAADVAPDVSGARAEYANVLPQVSLTLEALSYGSKESVVLASASAQRSFTYTMQLTGVTAQVASDGSVQFVDGTGTVVGEVPQGSMTDANVASASQQAPTSYGVSYALTSVNGTPALTMTLDGAWLDDPARVFPVTVDPTVIGSPNINASSGTFALNQGQNNNSTATVLKVGTCDVNVDSNCGITVKSRAFLSFPNIGSTYQNDKIDSASLNLLDVWSEVCSSVAFNVAPVTQNWNASDLVQYPGYSLGAQIGSASLAPGSACTNPNGAGTWMQVGLSTDIFNGWTAGTGAANYGLGIYAADTDGTWKQFASLNTANPPYLLLNYQANTAPSITGMNPPSGEALQNLTPELSATGWDPDGFPGKPLQYEFKVLDTSSGTPVQVADSNTISANNWVVPSGALRWSGTFTWQVRVSDQIGWGAWSYPSSLNPAIVQPTITSHLGGTNGTKGYDPLTGNYTAQATDANLSAIGPALTVQRTYNSLDPRVGQAFGSGWSSVLDSQAAVDSDNSGNVVATFANGQQVRFGKNGDGSFSPPSGMYATLSAAKTTEPAGSYCPSASAGYCLLDKTGTTYAFTTGGSSGPWQLSRVVDAQGRATLYSYNASNQLSSMTSCVSGCQGSSPVLTRSLTFAWTPAATLGNGAAFAHLTLVKSSPVTGTDPSTDLAWTYSYFGDRLTSVCDPVEQLSSCGNVTGYSYKSGSQFPAAVLDAGPQAYWRLADAANATSTTDQVLANEGTDAGTPTNVTFGTTSAIPGPSALSGAGPLNTGATVAAFNGTSSAVTLPSSLVQNTTYLSIGLWFETNASGSPQMLFSTGHSAVGTPNPSGAAMPVLYIGTDGKVYGHFWNGSATAIASGSPVNDGKWHYVLLTAAGSQQWMYVDGASAGSVSGQLANVDPDDLVGAGVFNSTYAWPAGGGGNSWSYFHGQLADVAFFPHTLGSTTAAAIYAAGSHASALLTAINRPSTAAQAAVTYDIPGNRVTNVVDSSGGSWQVGAPAVSGSSKVYAGAVLGSSPEGYWRLQGNGDSGGDAPLNSVNVANNEVTHHSTTINPGGCLPTGVCLQPSITTYDPEGDGVFNNATLGAAGSSPFSDMTGAQFDGSTSYAQLPGNLLPTSGPAAIELWFDTTATTGMLFSDESATIGTTTGSMVANLYVGGDGKLYGGFYTTTGKISMVSSGPVNNGAWHHVVLSTDGSDQTLYLDGTQIGSSVSTTPISQNSQPNVYVGAGTTGSNWPALPSLTTVHFNGSISDVAVYRHALSGQDVAAHFAALKSSAGLTPVVSVQVVDPLQLALHTTYDPMQGGRLLSSSDANGGTTRYGYDSGGFLNTVTDPLGDVTTTGHDVRGNEISKTVCQDQAAYQCSTSYTTYWPDDVSAKLSPDPRDDLRASTRDGRSASPSDPTYLTQYAYDSNGNVTAVTDPLGRKTPSTYSVGTETPLSVSLATSGAASCTTSSGSGTIPAGLLISKKTPGGGTTSYAYYANGDLAQTTSPLGDRVIDVYDGIGRVLFKTECSDTYPNGVVTAYTYDGDGRTQTEVDPATTDAVSGTAHQKTTTTGYTPDGQVDHTIVSDSGGSASAADQSRTTSYTYYPTGLVDTVTDPTGAVTTDSYDVEGNKTGEQDPNGDAWQYTYNGTGQRTSTVLTNYSGSASGVCQTSHGRLVKESRAYDLAGRLASVTDAMCRKTAYTYFDNGLTATVEQLDPAKTDGSGITEAKTYDGAGHLVSDTKGNGTAVTLTTYDAAGQNVLTKVLLGNDSSGNPQYKNTQTSYDLEGHPSSVLKWQDGLTGVEQTDYIHDAAGNVTSQLVHDSNAAQAQSANLAGAWPLNDGATATAKDGSGGNRPATVSGWTGWSSDAPSGLHGSLWMDGVSGQAATSSVPADTAKDYSVSAWAKLAVTPSGNETIAAAPGNNRGAFFLQYSKSAGGWSFLTTSADAATTTFYSATLVGAPAVGSWVHLVGVYNAESKTISLYVNGALAQTAAAPAAWTSAGGVDIGAYGGLFSGKIADVQLWNRTLSQTDVNQLYNRLSPGNQGLAGSWALDDGAATQGADSSALGHPVSPTGGVWWNASHGGSAVLDGSSGYLSTAAPVPNTANSYTVAAWVNMNQPSSYATAVSRAGANMSAFYLQYSYSVKTWAFVVEGADSNGAAQANAYSSSLTPAWNTWAFLTGVYDASAKTATLFVNGAQVASVPVTGTFNAGGPLVIGGVKTSGGALSNQVNGAVSGVSVYSKALTGGQISTLYAGGSLLAPNTTIKTHWTYDQRGTTTSMTAPMGNAPGATAGSYTTYYVSDQLGRVTQVQQPGITTHVNGVVSSGLVAPITWTGYDTFGDKLETEDPDGNVTATAYNQDGQPTGTTLPRYVQPGTGGQTLTVSTHIDYNTDGTVKDTLDPAGNQTSYTYDQFGAVLTQTNPPISVNNTPTAGVTVNQYDQDGELTQVTDPTGAVTQTAYNYLGQKSAQTAVVRQLGNNPAQNDQTTYTYDTLGDLASVTTPAPASVTTRTGYDDAGQKISATDGAGNVTKFSYDVDGRLKWTGNPDGSWLWNDYDLAGNQTRHAEYDTTGTLVRSQSAGYDLDGNASWATDFMGTTTSFSYDPDGNLTDQYEPTTASNTIHTSYGYDADGHRTQQTLGNTNTTIFTYNTWNLPESKIVPAAGSYTTPADSTYTTVYDRDANPVTQSQPGGVAVINTFDALGDLVTQSGAEPGVTSANRVLAYDLDGRVTNAATQDSSHNTLTSDGFTYDDRGALTSTAGNSGNSTFTYNTSGQMSSRTDASSTSATNYAYDTAGRLYSVADPITNTTATYGYNAFNQVASINYNGSGGDTRTLTYDKSHRLASDTLTAASHAQVAAIDYTYNNADQETEQDTYGIGTTSSNTAVQNSYTYDQAGRIASWNNGTTTTYYGYDNDGNRTCITINTAGCTQANSTYGYNARDQLTGDGAHTYAYAANGTLTGVTTTATNATEAFTFDAYQQMLTDGGTSYTYDALGRTITAGPTSVAYSGMGNEPASDGATVYARDPNGSVIADSNGGYPQEAWTDVHDNLVASFGPNGTGLGRWQTFDPLGNQVSANYWSLSLGYQSGYTTGGKVNMATRWYSPTTGQFDSADTQDNTANPSSVNANPYAYANENPLTGTDPSGHCPGCAAALAATAPGDWEPAGWIAVAGILAYGGWYWWDHSGSSSSSASGSSSTAAAPTWAGGVGDTWWNDFTGQADDWWDTPGLNPSVPVGNPGGGGGGLGSCADTDSCNSRLTCSPYCQPLPPPPPPLWQTTKNPNSPACKATGGLVCSTTTVGQANLPSIGGSSAFRNAVATITGGLTTALFCTTELRDLCAGRGEETTACDPGLTVSMSTGDGGMSVYLPRHMQAGQCVATGAFAELGPNDYTMPPRPSLSSLDVPGFNELPPGNRARGHLLAYAWGGSNENPRNFVAEYQTTNDTISKVLENPITRALKSGGHEWVDVEPIYGNRDSAVPTSIEYVVGGSVNMACFFDNTPLGKDYKCT